MEPLKTCFDSQVGNESGDNKTHRGLLILYQKYLFSLWTFAMCQFLHWLRPVTCSKFKMTCITLHLLWSPDVGSNVVFNKYNNTDILASMLPVYRELLQTDRLRVWVYRYSHPPLLLAEPERYFCPNITLSLKLPSTDHHCTFGSLKCTTMVQTVGFRSAYQVRWNNKCWKSCSMPTSVDWEGELSLQFVIAVEILMEECQRLAHGNGLPSLDLLSGSPGTPGFTEDPEKQRQEEDRYLLSLNSKCPSGKALFILCHKTTFPRSVTIFFKLLQKRSLVRHHQRITSIRLKL